MILPGDDLRIRLARLDDTAAIADVHRSHVPRWYRMLGNEAVDVDYDSLTVDERWGFGGPWMSVETCAVRLNGLLARRFMPLIAELDGRVVAEMELFVGREGPRYGKNCHIGLLYVHRDFMGRGIGNMMLGRAVETAREQKCDSLTVAATEAHENFYRHCGFSYGENLMLIEASPEKRPVEMVKLQPQVSAQTFTWGMDMSIGRVQSSAQHLFEYSESYAIPRYSEINKRIHYLKISGSDAAIAWIGHGSGKWMVGAWSRDVGICDLIDAVLTGARDGGIPAVYMYLSRKDYEAIEGRLDARLVGQRRTLRKRL